MFTDKNRTDILLHLNYYMLRGFANKHEASHNISMECELF